MTIDKQKFNNDGFLVLENFLDSSEIEKLLTEAHTLIDKLDPSQHPITVFTTSSDQKHARDLYFLKSANNISYFYEEASVKNGELQVPVSKALNKIGHALHVHSPVYKSLSECPKLQEVIQFLGFSNPVLLQSMLIFKHPGVGSEVTPHVDSTFLYSEPSSCIGFWFALEDATLDNGCLWFVPGSHKRLNTGNCPKFVRNPDYFLDDNLTVPNTSSLEPALKFEYPKEYNSDLYQKEEDLFVPVEVTAGSLVLIHGSALHRSNANLSDKSRFAFTFHVVEGNYKYPKENWLQLC